MRASFPVETLLLFANHDTGFDRISMVRYDANLDRIESCTCWASRWASQHAGVTVIDYSIPPTPPASPPLPHQIHYGYHYPTTHRPQSLSTILAFRLCHLAHSASSMSIQSKTEMTTEGLQASTAALMQFLRLHFERLGTEVSEEPKVVFYGFMVASLSVWLLFAVVGKFRKPTSRRATSPDLENPASKKSGAFKAPDRPPGVWIPSDFKRPAAEPYPDWDVHKTKPLPYRPFRHGPYHITMGLRTMKWDEWIELDNHYPKYHADKARRIAERGAKCCKTAPEAFDGAVELLEEL